MFSSDLTPQSSICAMRWCWAVGAVRFGGTHRESSPAMPPLQLPAWSRSRAVLKWLHSFQSLQAIPDEKCHLWVGVRKPKKSYPPKPPLLNGGYMYTVCIDCSVYMYDVGLRGTGSPAQTPEGGGGGLKYHIRVSQIATKLPLATEL